MRKIILILVTISLFFLLSCQETPERDIVINKNDDKFYEVLGQDKVMSIDIEAFPDKWEEKYVKFNGKLVMDIDADIIIEDVNLYPVMKIKPYYIPIEQANKIVDEIFGANEVYFNIFPLTKTRIEELIILVKADYQTAINDKDEELAKEIEDTLNDLTLLLEDAPDEAEVRPYNGDFEVYEDGNYEEITLRLDPVNKETPILEIRNLRYSEHSNGYDSEVVYYDPTRETYNYNDPNGNYLYYFENPTYKTDEAFKAIEIAENFIKNIDIQDAEVVNVQAFSYSSSDNKISGYRIYFSKKINNVVVPLFIQMGGSRTESQEYRRPFVAETLIVEVENNEIMYFEWRNMYEIDLTINEGVALLPFDEIITNAENQLATKYAYVDGQEYKYNLYVDRIMLTYAVEPVIDKKYEYILVPVWAFYGGYDYGDGCKIDNGTILEGKYKEAASLLTINAVDGTVIIGR